MTRWPATIATSRLTVRPFGTSDRDVLMHLMTDRNVRATSVVPCQRTTRPRRGIPPVAARGAAGDHDKQVKIGPQDDGPAGCCDPVHVDTVKVRANLFVRPNGIIDDRLERRPQIRSIGAGDDKPVLVYTLARIAAHRSPLIRDS